MIGQRIEPTVALSIVTIVLAVTFAVPLGTLAAWRAGRWIDRLVMALAITGFSVPVFVIGYVLIFVFSLEYEWLPVQGYVSPRENLGEFFSHMILPAIALGLVYMALIARITRASVLEVLSQDYIRTARAKGLAEDKVLLGHALKNAAVPIVTIIGIGVALLGHALKNAAVPIVTIIGIGVALLIGGVVVTESVFAIPGLGRLTVDAILRRDYPIIQGVILLFSLVYVLLNLLVDLSYTLFDPRIRY
jgi:peptide/nickel transport system permease protein